MDDYSRVPLDEDREDGTEHTAPKTLVDEVEEDEVEVEIASKMYGNSRSVYPLQVKEIKDMESLEMEPQSDIEQAETCTKQAVLFAKLALPTAIIQITVLLIGTISTSFVGQNMGRHELAGFSVSILAANLLGNSFILGMLSGMDTLAPQAYGAKRYENIGYLAQTSFVLCILISSIVVFIFFNASSILRFLGQPEEAIGLAQRYLRIYTLALPADIVYNIIRRFLWCQNIINVFMLIGSIVVVLHVCYLHAYVKWLGLGFDGVGFAAVSSSYSSMILSLLYVSRFCSYHPQTWTGINLAEALDRKRVVAYLRLGLPGIIANNEWWFWETICMFAGKIGELELASHTIAYNVVPLAFMLPLGLEIASTTRLGTLLAINDMHGAIQVGRFAYVAGIGSGAFSGIICFSFRNSIIRFFSGGDEQIFNTTLEIWGYVIVFVLFDAIQGSISGVLRGLAAQFQLSVLMSVMLWVLGVPFMYLWTFTYGHGLIGIWQSMCFIYVFLTIIMTYVCYYWIDWTKAVIE